MLSRSLAMLACAGPENLDKARSASFFARKTASGSWLSSFSFSSVGCQHQSPVRAQIILWYFAHSLRSVAVPILFQCLTGQYAHTGAKPKTILALFAHICHSIVVWTIFQSKSTTFPGRVAGMRHAGDNLEILNQLQTVKLLLPKIFP